MDTHATSSKPKGKGKSGDDLTVQMELLDNDTFMKRLGELFESTKTKGSVWLTQKRYTYDGTSDVKMEAETDDQEYPCLLRATDGTTKFETRISSTELPKFHLAYSALLRASITTLRKRDRKKEKLRAEEAALRKKRLVEDVVVEGPKRGNGRRKRVRREKAAVRQEEARKTAAKREEQQQKTDAMEWSETDAITSANARKIPLLRCLGLCLAGRA